MYIGDFPESWKVSQAMLVGCNVSGEIGRRAARAERPPVGLGAALLGGKYKP